MRRLAVFEAAGGICHLCGLRIQRKWEVEHVIPLALGGADDETNMAPAHKECHAVKSKVDATNYAKARRVKARHIGIKRSSNPMPGSRGTKYRKRMDGTVVLR